MNTTEAKFILQARRPDGRDDADPCFAAALEQARRDPVLGEWLERERAFDEVVAARLRSVQPPAGLRDAILSGASLGPMPPFWRRPQVLATAACVTLILGLAAFWTVLIPPADVEQLARGAMAEVDSVSHHKRMPFARGELRALLSNPATRLAAGVDMDIDRLKADGCRTVRIAGHDVLEACFERGGEFHLYIGRREDFPGDAEPMFRERGKLAAVSWADSRHAYVLVTDEGGAALRNVF